MDQLFESDLVQMYINNNLSKYHDKATIQDDDNEQCYKQQIGSVIHEVVHR